MTSVDKRKSHSIEWLFFASSIAVVLLAGCTREQAPVTLSGATMGTTWQVTYTPQGVSATPRELQSAIEDELEAVNAAMSTYRIDAEITAFNALGANQPMAVSQGFAAVMAAALSIGEHSKGAYDVTVGPLVRLWGFGPDGAVHDKPDDAQLQEALATVGQGALSLTAAGELVKAEPREVDLSSIAKGYGIDRLAETIASSGVSNYLVEIGGELRVAGNSPRGDAWRLAIEQPDAGRRRAAAAAVSMNEGAIATSGDYRNYFEVDGVRYSHTIDPRTGYPVRHDLASVTVIHSSAMMADGWATALLALGMPDAMNVANAQGLAVYLIQQQDDQWVTSYSEAFNAYLAPLGDQ